MKIQKKFIYSLLTLTLLGVNFGNVKAIADTPTTCPDGGTKYTNYYIFLEGEGTDYINAQVDAAAAAGKSFQTTMGGNKYNNYSGKDEYKLTKHGNVAITLNSKSTVTGSTDITWTAEDFWREYYKAWKGKDTNYAFKEGNNTYLLHDKWDVFINENDVSGEEQDRPNRNDLRDKLFTIVENSLDDLTNSELITDGTIVPNARIDLPSGFATTTSPYVKWNVARTFSADDKNKKGIMVGTFKSVYAPAVYYVDYCKVAEETPIKEKYTITYYENAGIESEYVTNMPDKYENTKPGKISADIPNLNGYKFIGWSNDPESRDVTKYKAGDTQKEKNLKLYAVWDIEETPIIPEIPEEKKEFIVKYNPNGGKNAPESQKATEGSCVEISSKIPEYPKNKFMGWSRDKDAKEADSNFNAGENYCGEYGDIELYAVWSPQTGINSHFLTFGSVALGSVLAYLIAKKKTFFKQF